MSSVDMSNKLIEAVERGELADVIQMLDDGADIEARNEFGSPLLITAASRGYTKIVACLLNRKANIHVTAEENSTPLHNAKNREITWMLLAHGASLEVRDEFGATPLHWSVIKPECLNVLLSWGAEIEAEDNEGYTPIWRAIDEDAYESVVTLILCGASIAPMRVGTIGRGVYHNNFDIFLVMSKMLIDGPGLKSVLDRKRPEVLSDLLKHQIENIDFIELWESSRRAYLKIK